MYMLEWFKAVYEKEYVMTVSLCVGAVLLVLAALVAYANCASGIYVAIASVFGGGVGITVACGNVGERAATAGISLLLIFGGLVYLLLFFALSLRKGIAERKRRRQEAGRRLQYTLPERENGYVRERLQTSLHVENCREEIPNATCVRLGYASALLGRVREAPLSVAERLQAEEIGKVFSLYKGKELWTEKELRSLNDLCASLLKLAAKYSV